AGVHSGDSACSLPPWSLSRELQDEIRHQTVAMARELGVIGLMNVQFALVGESLRSLDFTSERIPAYTSVKEAVFPFIKFPGVDTLLGPEMRSTGEVMGIDRRFGIAFAKAEEAAGNRLPASGCALVTVRDEDKARLIDVARTLVGLGFQLVA